MRSLSGGKTRSALGSTALLLLLTACGTVQEHRARQLDADFAALEPATRERLLRGDTRIGDTPEAVYIALGTPAYTTTDNSGAWRWIYWGTPRTAGTPRAEAAVPAFHTRAEFRLPKPGEQRRELQLSFRENVLTEWVITAIDMSAAARHESLPMGTVPAKPAETDAHLPHQQ